MGCRLELGADSYVEKTIQLRRMMARVRAQLRRVRPTNGSKCWL
jgi:DNA-binding response OmpR family regulator